MLRDTPLGRTFTEEQLEIFAAHFTTVRIKARKKVGGARIVYKAGLRRLTCMAGFSIVFSIQGYSNTKLPPKPTQRQCRRDQVYPISMSYPQPPSPPLPFCLPRLLPPSFSQQIAAHVGDFFVVVGGEVSVSTALPGRHKKTGGQMEVLFTKRKGNLCAPTRTIAVSSSFLIASSLALGDVIWVPSIHRLAEQKMDTMKKGDKKKGEGEGAGMSRRKQLFNVLDTSYIFSKVRPRLAV
jgi:hypothetical protein